MNYKCNVAIIGTVGIPASYGGFETLAENIVQYHDENAREEKLIVYCSSKSYSVKNKRYLSASLKYIPLKANGLQSILYDVVSIISAILNRCDVILLLGISGAIILPFIRTISSARIITNIDGIEWRREKWRGIAKYYLRISEKIAVRHSHEIISDNEAIAEYVQNTYNKKSQVITYGGDHAIAIDGKPISEIELPEKYALSIGRVEPENNTHLILESFKNQANYPLVIVGNWGHSKYGQNLRNKYIKCSNIYMLDPIYDLGKLKTLRSNATLYIHGHSAGGTNPSLVEAMHFAKPILAYDCSYNRVTTKNSAKYFRTEEQLAEIANSLSDEEINGISKDMMKIANNNYLWRIVAAQYFNLIEKEENIK